MFSTKVNTTTANELTAAELLYVQTGASGVLELTEGAAPSATSGKGKIYVKSSDSKLYFKDDSGTEYDLTAAASIDGSGTTNELAYWVDSNTLGALAVATYPSLTELTYLKGVTSAIQTQLNAKAAALGADDNYVTDAQLVVIANTSGTNTGDNATNTQYSGLAASKADVGQTFYIGTTQVAINRASAALTLAGITLTTPDIGTPSAGTLTNCTGLPIAGLTPSTSTALGVGSIELGHASDTTLSRSAAGTLAVEGIRVQTTTPLVVSATSYTTDTGTSLNMDNLDMFVITAQAGALLFNSPGGTLVQGRSLIIRIKDNGTARALTWNAVFRAMGTALPSTTVLSKTLYLGFKYNSTDTKWDLIASAQEA